MWVDMDVISLHAWQTLYFLINSSGLTGSETPDLLRHPTSTNILSNEDSTTDSKGESWHQLHMRAVKACSNKQVRQSDHTGGITVAEWVSEQQNCVWNFGLINATLHCCGVFEVFALLGFCVVWVGYWLPTLLTTYWSYLLVLGLLEPWRWYQCCPKTSVTSSQPMPFSIP